MTTDVIEQHLATAFGALAAIQTELASRRTSPRTILSAVAELCGLSGVDLRLRCPRKATEVVWARQVAMHALWTGGQMSTTAIAQMLALRDHTTVLYGRDKVRARLERDVEFRARYVAALGDFGL